MTLSSTGFNETTVNQALGIIPTVPLSITFKKVVFFKYTGRAIQLWNRKPTFMESCEVYLILL